MSDDPRTATAFDRKMGARIRARRLEIGMSQERLAELLGVTFQQVQKYEKGINRVSSERIWDISGALDLPVIKFFPDPTHPGGRKGPREGEHGLRISEQLLEAGGGVGVAKAFIEANDEGRDAITRCAKAIAEVLPATPAKKGGK